MTDSMIERVARAIALANLDDETARVVDLDAHMAHVRDHYEELARAAIEAIFKGSRFTEFRGMTVIANPDFPAQCWDGSELLEMLPADAALAEKIE